MTARRVFVIALGLAAPAAAAARAVAPDSISSCRSANTQSRSK